MNILAAFAHPDDETILIGGTLAMLASRGAQVHIVAATRGEGGEVGEPPICRQSELGIFRAQELKCAVAALDASSLTFLNYLDPLVSEGENARAFDTDPARLSKQLLKLSHKYEARAVITHGTNGEYGHPAHLLMNQAAKLAHRAANAFSLYTVSAAFPDHPRPRLANKDDPADLVFSVESWFRQKLNAARCHRSQKALFLRRSSQEAGRRLTLEEVLMRLESLHYHRAKHGPMREDALSSFIHQFCSDAIRPTGSSPEEMT